jgi:galactonate dehydratase
VGEAVHGGRLQPHFLQRAGDQGAAFVRPDLSLAGGITNVKKIASMAEAAYVGVVPHNPLSCVLTAACVQIDAAVHNISVQEYPYDDDHGIKAELVKEPLKRVGGYLEVPTKPGIGIELNEEAFKHHPPIPYDRPPLINEDGSLREY